MSWYDAIKDAIDTAKKFDQIELYEKLLKLREEMNQLRDENIAKTEQIRSLEERLELKELIVFEKGVYWIKNDPATRGGHDTPICPRCYDSEKKICRLPVLKFSGGTYIECKNCKTESTIV